jgi:hypothetical protein
MANTVNELIEAYEKQILATNTVEELETLKASITHKVDSTISDNDIVYKAPASVYPVWHNKNPDNTEKEGEPECTNT